MPYEDILQRNALLAIECLADDIHIQPALRQEILDLLGKLSHHRAPQVREAALLQYQRIAQTRHRDAAIQSLKREYLYDETQNPPAFQKYTSINVGIALIHLGERDLAQTIIWPISENSNYDTETFNKARRLRFEFWPEQASEYLYQYITQAQPPLITASSDLENTNIIWLNGSLALRVLEPFAFHNLLDRLILDIKHDGDRAALQWMRILVNAGTKQGKDATTTTFHELLAPHIPAHIRRFAATKLLEGNSREQGIEVLHELIDNAYGQSVAAAEALIASGEGTDSVWNSIRDAAWMSQHFAASQAVEALLRIGDEASAIPAALQLFATYNEFGWKTQRDQRLYELTAALLRHGKTTLGIAAARWLALRAGYMFRLEACELMVEYGHMQEAIPLLQFLAIECHDESSQRACQRLLILRELDRVIPLLSNVVNSADPERQYRAALALALADVVSDSSPSTVDRAELKVVILSERQLKYNQALNTLVDVGTRELDMLMAEGEKPLVRAIGIASLQLLLPMNGYADREDVLLVTDDTTPALQVSAAYFDLRRGAVGHARQRLRNVLTHQRNPPSLLVHVLALQAMSEAAAVDDVEIFVNRLDHPNSTIRWSASHALIGRNASVAREQLLRALTDDSASVRSTVATVLGQVQDSAVVEGLIRTLVDSDEGVRDAAETALMFQGEVAIKPLMSIVAKEEEQLRTIAMQILHHLHKYIPASYFIDALNDPDSQVRAWAARALGFMPGTAATPNLLVMLQDSDSNVRERAVAALVERHDSVVLSYLPTLIKENLQLSIAIQDLFKFGADAIPVLIDIVATEHHNYAITAVGVLAKLQATTAIPYLMEKLNSGNMSLQAACIAVLGELKVIAAIPEIKEKLKSSDAQVRAAAARALGVLQAKDAIELLTSGLHDSHSNVVEASISALGMFDEEAPLSQLLDVLATSWCGRAEAVSALATVGTEEAQLALVKALGNEDERARSAAARAISESRQESAIQGLIACLADDSTHVRSAAAEALGHLKVNQALPSLCTLLNDSDSNVRTHAARALGALEDPSSVVSLMRCLLDTEEYVRDAATEALGQLKATQASILLETATLPSGLFDFSKVMQRVEALLQIQPAAVLSVLKYRGHLFWFAPWLEKLYTGQALWLVGQQEEAGKNLLEAVGEHSSATTLLPLGHYYLELGDLKTAEQYILMALEDEPESPECLLSEAIILWLQGNKTEATGYFARVHSVDPTITEIVSLRDKFWRTTAIASVEAIRNEINKN